MSNSGISSLPIEAIELILDFIHSPSDILSVGLTCRALSSLVIPSHLHYRILRIGLRNLTDLGLWSHMYEKSFRANNVRILELGVPMALERIPPSIGWGASTDEQEAGEAEDMFLHALGLMNSLRSFKISTDLLPEHKLETAWHALNRATTLRELHVTSHNGLIHGGSEDDFKKKQRFKIVNTKLFSLRWPSLEFVTLILYMSDGDELGVPSLASFLLSCVHLTSLEMRIYYRHAEDVDLSALFSQARWPSLRRLELIAVGANADAVRSFIIAHPLLERIGYRAFGFSLEDLPVGCLPNLRSFGGHSQRDLPTLAHAKPPLLEEITHIYVHTTIRVFGESLMVFKPTLRRLQFYFGVHVLDAASMKWLHDNLPGVELV